MNIFGSHDGILVMNSSETDISFNMDERGVEKKCLFHACRLAECLVIAIGTKFYSLLSALAYCTHKQSGPPWVVFAAQ